MDHKQFFDLTAQVREAQKEYFRTPKENFFAKRDAQTKAINLEKQLDQEIERVQKYLRQKELERISPSFDFGETGQ